jgi:hypothetical protein
MASWNYVVLDNGIKLPLNCGNNRSEWRTAQFDVVLSTAVRFGIAIQDCGRISLFLNRINISCCQKKYTVGCLWGWTKVERRQPNHELKRMAVILPWNAFFTVEKMYATEKTTWYKSSGWLFLKPPFLVSKTTL